VLLKEVYTFTDSFTSVAVPSGPPTNFQVRADTTRSLVLSWDPPLPQHQNGIVRLYIVTIALNNSAQVLTNVSTTAHTVRVTAQIKPFRVYLCSVAAETIAVGPATEDVAVLTPEDSKCFPTKIFCHSKLRNCNIISACSSRNSSSTVQS